MSTRTPSTCLNCEHPVPAHGEEVCGQPSTFPDGTPYQCGCTWGDDDQDDAAEEATPAGDHFTEAAIRRGVMLAAADEAENAAKLFPDNIECAPAIGALEGLAARFKRLADHYATAEQPSGPTWEARADHAIRLYATTAIERDDARAEAARLRAERATLIEQRDRIADDTIKALIATEPAAVEPCAQHPTAPRIGDMCGGCTQYPTDMVQPSEYSTGPDGEPIYHHRDVDGDRLLIGPAFIPAPGDNTTPGLYFRTDPSGSSVKADELPTLLARLTTLLDHARNHRAAEEASG